MSASIMSSGLRFNDHTFVMLTWYTGVSHTPAAFLLMTILWVGDIVGMVWEGGQGLGDITPNMMKQYWLSSWSSLLQSASPAPVHLFMSFPAKLTFSFLIKKDVKIYEMTVTKIVIKNPHISLHSLPNHKLHKCLHMIIIAGNLSF